jgi:hypothetical protein
MLTLAMIKTKINNNTCNNIHGTSMPALNVLYDRIFMFYLCPDSKLEDRPC